MVLFLLRFGFSHRSSFRLRRWGSLWLWFDYREIHSVDSACRALSHTFLAELTLCEVDVCEIVLDSDCLERTNLCTLAAADTCSLACLARSGTRVLVHA